MKIAISSCLAGNAVRYDGKHKRSLWLEKLQQEGAELVAICPEVEIGMPVPRPTIELIQSELGSVRVKAVGDSSQDFTAKMAKLFEDKLALINTCGGFICAEKSPSCGYKTTVIYDHKKRKLTDNGSGLFIAKVAERFPSMPIINHRDLNSDKDVVDFLRAVKEANKAISLAR